jgi:hypothetical protein
LEESFGGAVRADNKNREKLNSVSFLNIDQIWLEKLLKYIKEA